VLGLLDPTTLIKPSDAYVVVFVLCVLQSCCVPTSSELTMGFAGVLAAQGRLNLAAVIAVGVAGELVGAYVAYAVGRFGGRAFVDRYGKYVLLSHTDLDRAEAWYARHQRFGVMGSRMVPFIRNFVAVPAGIAEVPVPRFGALTTAGSLVWDGAWAAIGYGVGTHWQAIVHAFNDAGYVIAAGAVAVIALAVVHRYRSYRAATAVPSRVDVGRELAVDGSTAVGEPGERVGLGE
jgi:membrane protein DedA with SNARE-associated domain